MLFDNDNDVLLVLNMLMQKMIPDAKTLKLTLDEQRIHAMAE